MKSRFKRTISWSKYQSRASSTQAQDHYLDYLIDPSFQTLNRIFVLSFEDDAVRTWHTEYVLPNVELKDYNFMINGPNFFYQLVKNEVRTYDVRKIALS